MQSSPEPRSHRRLVVLNGIASVLTVAVEYALYLTLVEAFAVDIRIANVCGGALGILVNFLLSRHWVFAHAPGHFGAQFLRYGLATAAGIAGSTGLLHVQVVWLGIPHWIAWGAGNLAMFTLWTYPTNRYFVFPEKRSEKVAIGEEAAIRENSESRQ